MKKPPKSEGVLSWHLNYDLKMKLSLLFFLTISFLMQANSSYAQKTKISIERENSTVREVLEDIETLTEFKFLFNTRAVDLSRKVTIKVDKAPIDKVLDLLFKNVDTSYELDDRKILLRKKERKSRIKNESLLIAPYQQTVSGIVTDADGIPLPGANIVEKGTSNGVTADFDGNFSIEVSDKNAILSISYIGYTTKDIVVEGTAPITVQLQPDAAKLEEVVVVGYGTQRKTDLTGAIATVKSEDFTQGANYDAVQLLNGAASGVNVSQVSSAPGAGLKVQIRGAGSINSDNSVLFVVDGLPGVDPSSLSPGDIESIDVLKDASSAAIYGTRAASGVVLITTKKGKAGKTSLSYSTYTGFQSVAKSLDVLGANDYADLVNFRSADTYSPEQIAGFGAGTDWQDELFQNATVQNHQISLSGGNEKGNYYLGLNYFDQDGIVKSSSSQKYNIRLNVQSRPLENLLISANANFTRQTNNEILFSNSANENAGPINSAIQFDPTLSSALDENGRYFRNASIALDNPLALIYGIDNQTVLNRFYASINTDYEVVKNVTASLRLGGESNTSRADMYRSRATLSGLAQGGIGTIESIEQTHWLVEALLKYSNTFNENHNFSIFGGVTFEEFLNRSFSANSEGFLSDVTATNLLQSGNGDLNDDVTSGKQKNQLNGFIGRATYDYKGKYLLTASFRVDGSSRFSPDNKYAFFPSASLGWRVSQEPFLVESNTVSNLKLRLGYGELGNQGINNFETRQTLISQSNNGSNSVFGGSVAQGVVAARLPNPDLKWETTTEINVGIDYGFLNNRISGSVDLFKRKTSDQLFNKPLPSVVGFTNVRTNLGEVENSGVDFNVNTININKDDFQWTTGITMSFLKNEVTMLPDFTEEIIGGNIGTFIQQYTVVREGAPLQSFYGYEIDGIFQVGDDIANSPTPDFLSGQPRFIDQDGDGDVDADDRVVLGDPFPDFSFGFNNNFKYKNLSLEIFLQGVQGIESLDANVTESLYPTNSARNSISKYYNERWTPENPSNTLPSGENPSQYGGARAINSLTITDASFIRLKNITLGYNIPLKDTFRISSLGLYAAVDNLFTITDFEGYDPDASAEGTGVERSSYNSYPLARTIRLGLDIKF
ncbi:TonB-dependent receptor [Zobellia roscoffensis]|uniref:TonB-dependent receptor n=1 Tax=Zobellia roscoffensis TaxID=2779508 RepID=UPI00188C4452|nr:TonB-dependent receptor [Zobellia roscoffensis]